MRSSFFGYYPPTSDEYERLWNEGLIVLDTNVLLDLYRLPTVARDELFVVLESLKERLWIPHQVALEFHRKRLAVIAAERKTMEDALTSASDLVTTVEEKVNALQIEKRGIGIDPDALISDLNRANSQLVEAIKKAHTSQLDISASDPVRERLDELLSGRVGTGPSNQAELDELCIDGENRYRENIPPGFKDADKDKNPKEATFIFDHIKYQRKYGDLILWRQLIRHVKDAGIKAVVLVTADRKDDWWWREQGKTIGPHSELVREIRRDGQVDLFWMYSSVQFVEHANKYSAAQVSVESVAEIQNVTSTQTLVPNARHEKLIESPEILRFNYTENIRRYPYDTRQLDLRFAELSFGNWLENLGYDVTYNESVFPDILVGKGQGIHGYEVKSTKNLRKFLFSESAINALMQGYIEKNERRLNAFSLVIFISEEHFEEEMEREEDNRLVARCNLLLREYSADEIIVGSLIQENFELLYKFINPVT